MHDFKDELKHCKTPGVVDTWHCDNGTKLTAHEVNDFCIHLGTKRTFSPPHCPDRNAHVERTWYTLLRPMRIMIAHAGYDELKAMLWPFLMLYACDIHCALPSTLLNGLSPHEALYGQPADLTRFRVIFCDCFATLRRVDKPSKLSSARTKCIFLGINPKKHGYRVYIPSLNRITTLDWDVTFKEEMFTALANDVDPAELLRRCRAPTSNDNLLPNADLFRAPLRPPLRPGPGHAAAPAPALASAPRKASRATPRPARPARLLLLLRHLLLVRRLRIQPPSLRLLPLLAGRLALLLAARRA